MAMNTAVHRYIYVSLVAPHEASTAMRHSNRLRLFDVGLPNFQLRSHEQKLSKKRCLMSWQPGISSCIDYRTLDCTSGRHPPSIYWARSCKQSVLPADRERAQRRYELFPPEAQAWTRLRHCAGCHNKNSLNSVFMHTAVTHFRGNICTLSRGGKHRASVDRPQLMHYTKCPGIHHRN